MSQSTIQVLKRQIPLLHDSSAAFEVNRSNLRFVDFAKGNFGNIQFAGDDLTSAIFRATTLSSPSVIAYSVMDYADLSDSHMAGVSMHDACFAHAVLRNADVSGANLDRVDFRGVNDLDSANLAGATLTSANMRAVDLMEVKSLKAGQLDKIVCDVDIVFPKELEGGPVAKRCASITK